MKIRFLCVALLVFSLAACTKGGDTEDAGGPGESPMAGAKGTPSAVEAPAVGDTDAGGQDQDGVNCLNLVKEARFAEALPVCTDALKRFPDNLDIKAALDKAKKAAGAAVEGAVGGAKEVAGDAVGEAKKTAGEGAKSLDEAASQGVGGVGGISH